MKQLGKKISIIEPKLYSIFRSLLNHYKFSNLKVDVLMAKQSRFLCIGGFLNGTQVKDQGGSFVCVENSKNVTYRKMEIFHQDSWDQDYYVCETTTDQQAKNWVYDIE